MEVVPLLRNDILAMVGVVRHVYANRMGILMSGFLPSSFLKKLEQKRVSAKGFVKLFEKA